MPNMTFLDVQGLGQYIYAALHSCTLSSANSIPLANGLHNKMQGGFFLKSLEQFKESMIQERRLLEVSRTVPVDFVFFQDSS